MLVYICLYNLSLIPVKSTLIVEHVKVLTMWHMCFGLSMQILDELQRQSPAYLFLLQWTGYVRYVFKDSLQMRL